MILLTVSFQLKGHFIPNETTDLSKTSANDGLQRLRVPFAKGRSFDMCWLNLTAMVDNLAIDIDE